MNYRKGLKQSVTLRYQSQLYLELRAIWQAVNGKIPMEYFVWIDEAAVDDYTNQQNTD
ncbi:hypothetical protein BDQ17DRAFT_1309077 [Cyathus striatus]|nr:hypothetical protein BDQ17DRAFT_1371229 [Cyathus striatus]KAF8998518.1 hypothetical protein BDQ17DRAFT_1309077 [Cyathus striatus]